jgi:RNA polymerase sigma-70 factor (ECF subfamily)
MMRVTRLATGNGTEMLRVEGRLTHETAEELRMACEAVLTKNLSLQLDVSGVQFVDPAGVALLRHLEERGTRLAGCSGFVDQMLREPARGTMPSGPKSKPAADAPLVERLRSGDPEASETVVRQYGGRMLATARRFVGNDDDARDVVQDAFLAAFRALDTFAGTAMLSTWLHRIVINTALMRLRSRRRRREESIEDLLPRFDESGGWAEPATHWDVSAHAMLERRETRTVVRKAIDQLPATYRTVLLLRDIEDLDTEEAAELLGVTPNAVKTRLHRARQALRTLLEREFAKPPASNPVRLGQLA